MVDLLSFNFYQLVQKTKWLMNHVKFMDDNIKITGVSISRRRPLFIQGSLLRCLKHCYQLGP